MLGQLVMAARGQKDSFTITGTDLPTRDGTGIRDYIHVWDLARGARAGRRAVRRRDRGGRRRPASSSTSAPATGVDRARAGRRLRGVFGHDVPITEAPPRPGDAVGAFANVDRAAELSTGAPSSSLDEAIASALAWGEKRQEILGYE